MDFEAMLQQMREQYQDALEGMALPPGVEDHVRKAVASGDPETIVFMLKLAWVFGAQAGHAAAEQSKLRAADTKHRVLA
ncbi:MAG TPA: DdrH [Deinococcales bacterium]|nr:DdrH [Deinococcales bacterium]